MLLKQEDMESMLDDYVIVVVKVPTFETNLLTFPVFQSFDTRGGP